VRTAGEQHDVGADTRQPCPDVTPNGARPSDDDFHEAFCEYTRATAPR
jgi:hypothetical protein